MPVVLAKCPDRQTKLRLKGDRPQGKPIKCPKCGRRFRVGKDASAKPRKRPTPKQDEPVDEFELPPPTALRHPRKTRRSGKKPREPDKPAFPWLKVSIIVGAFVALAGIGFVGYIMFQMPAGVRIGSGGSIEEPKEFVEVEFGERAYIYEHPKGWKVTSGGGKKGIPPWTKSEKGGAIIQIRDSLSGTPAANIDRALGFGNAIEQGKAPADDVHEHRKKGVAESMRNCEEGALQKLDHKLGDAVIAEFTAKPLFGAAIRGYHATVLHEYHQFTIVCRCTESQWKTLKPAFMHSISTLAPCKSDDIPEF